MKQVTEKVHTGSSAPSFSFSLAPTKKSTRVHSGRKYYRNKTVWVCRERAAHDDPGYFRRQEEAARKRAELEARQRAEDARREAIRKAETERLEAIRRAELARIENLKKNIEGYAINYGELNSTRVQAFEKLQSSDSYKKYKIEFQERIQKAYLIESVDADQFAHSLLGGIKSQQILDGFFNIHRYLDEKILPEGKLITEKWISKEKKSRRSAKAFLVVSVFGIALTGIHAGWLVLTVPTALVSTLLFHESRRIVGLSRALQEVTTDLFKSYESIILGLIHSAIGRSDYINEAGAKDVVAGLFVAAGISSGKDFTQGLDEPKPGSDFSAGPSIKPEIRQAEVDPDEQELKATSPESMSFKDLTREIFEAENFFDLACLLLMSDVAAADGQMSEDEMRFITQTVGVVDDRDSKLVIEFAKRKSHYKVLIKLLNKRYPPTSVAIQELVNNLFYLAEADQRFEQKELDAIRRIAMDLGMDENEFNDVLQGVLRRHKPDVEDQGSRIIDEIFDEIDFDDLQE